MIKYTNSNVFNANTEAIVNTINCVGFMGKGIALEYSYRYPKLLSEYKEKCNNKEILPGHVYYFKAEDKYIVNVSTKNDYKYPSKIEWIENALIEFKNSYKLYAFKSIAFPLLGCGNGGLDFKQVKILMEKYLSDLDIEVYICLDRTNPEGKELEMLNNLKNISLFKLAEDLKLGEKQLKVLKENRMNIKRFFEIGSLEGIGSTTYKKIFDYFYVEKNGELLEQQSLF